MQILKTESLVEIEFRLMIWLRKLQFTDEYKRQMSNFDLHIVGIARHESDQFDARNSEEVEKLRPFLI